jgi:hypothetical protein
MMEIQLYELVTSSHGETNGTGRGEKQTNRGGMRREEETVACCHYAPSISLYQSLSTWWAGQSVYCCFLSSAFRKHPTVVWFQVITAVVMKSTVFRDITPCNPLKTNRRFRETYRLHLQSRISRVGLPSASTLVTCWAYSTLNMEEYIFLKYRLAFNGLQGNISQNTVVFSNSTVICNW